ncbi:single-stranded DNA-binding protein [Enterococcus dispar]|uniref:single-stranded DNA-binding protein n=1 Tax=Enterococcus dispar TaxID=44009 RepID=UPI0021D439F8|nr:single-stranded DNA-binding protein [Enterococcus dispar]MCU7356278.1 single-stranded DNA-binding protein [Enterococcus dispar]
MINNVVLVGRLTKEPDLRYTSNGTAAASFTLAVNRSFKNANGDREADFINCVIWRKPAETLANYARKGTLLGVTGRIQTRNYENQQGQRVYVTEVVVENFQLLESKNSNSSQNTSTASVPNAQTNNYAPDNQNATQTNLGVNPINDFEATTIDINDDDLPF